MDDTIVDAIMWLCIGWGASVIVLGLCWNYAVDKCERYKKLYQKTKQQHEDCKRIIQEYYEQHKKREQIT